MLSRLIPKPSLLYRVVTLTRSPTHLFNSKSILRSPSFSTPNHYFLPRTPHFSFFSTDGKNGGDDSPASTTDLWKMSSEVDDDIDSVFSAGAGDLQGINDEEGGAVKSDGGKIGDPFGGSGWKDLDNGSGDIFSGGGGDEEGEVAPEDFKPWSFTEEGKEGAAEDLFGVKTEGGEETGAGDLGDILGEGIEKSEQDVQLELEEKALTDVIKGPNRAFGDLIALSGITDEMLDSLIALKDFEGIQGLPPLSEIEEKRYEKNSKKSRGEMSLQKQEEAAMARVRKVDEKGRAYGTGRRKCSIANVWIQPGGGKFFVNDKEFDVYFPMLDHRATLLRPFSETKTLGMWDVKCNVRGGGTSGQVGAIRLGISRALQNWEPGFRPPLKQAGFLMRDPRVVERKKPGKAKARKSFQWVKR